jgi:hypothetical protein
VAKPQDNGPKAAFSVAEIRTSVEIVPDEDPSRILICYHRPEGLPMKSLSVPKAKFLAALEAYAEQHVDKTAKPATTTGSI